MYAEDSFFTLTSGGQVLVGSISLLLAIVSLGASIRLSMRQSLPARMIGAFAVFFFFVWLSPQIYYTCYIFLLGVPWQVVIGTPPSPTDLLRLLTFTDRANLSFHGQGLLGWLLIVTAMLQPRFAALRHSPSDQA